MYKDQRKLVRLTEECWHCLSILRDTGYAHMYTVFWAENAQSIQQAVRRMHPDISGDWLRAQIEGKTVTFSLSDEFIESYKPRIVEFSSFGTAVRMLGAYEDYIKRIVDISRKRIPEQIAEFRARHRGINNRNSFIKAEVGRGVDFAQEVFGFDPQPSYRPCLEFFFQLRNVAVHNSGIVDQRLFDAANNPYIDMVGTLRVGDKISWNPSSTLQLQHLLTEMLPAIDPLVAGMLNLETIEGQAYWYRNGGGD